MNPLFEPDGERQDAIMSENEDEEAMMIDIEEEDVIMIDHEEPSGTCDETLMRNRDHLDAQPQVPSSNTLWVTPETVGLYCQVQDRGNCALHALNAMAGRAIITPNEAQALLRHPQVPRPADGERPDCNADGWFRWEAINKLLYYTTTIELTLLVLENPQNRPQQSVSTTSAKARVLALEPQGCNALFLHQPGHFICWKRSPINGKWYSLDSIPYATSHKIKELTADWAAFDGTISTTIAADAYLHHSTGLLLYRHRHTRAPNNRSHMDYVDLEGIELTKAGPTARPAAAWIAEDTERAHARDQRIAQARAQARQCKQLPKSTRQNHAQSNKAPQIAQADLKHSHPHNKPTKAQKQADTRHHHSLWRPATPLRIRVCRQLASHCGLHALEAMVGHAIATPPEVTKYLQATWPAGEDKQEQQGGHYSRTGNYSDLALQRILYWFWCRRVCEGTESLEMQVVTGHAQLQKGSSSEAIIGLLHQAEAFMINYAIDPFAGQNGSRHWQVVRKGRTDNDPTPDWYLVDSLDQAAHTAQVKIMTEADWKNIHGTLYIIKQCTESRMLDSCEFTDEELLAHQQRLEGEEAGAARVPMRNHNTLPHLNTRQGPAQRAGLIQTTINKVDEHAPMNPREPRQPSKPQNIQAPKTANPNAHSSSTPDIGNYFHKLAQPTTHTQEVMHQPLHTTDYSVPTTDDGTRPTPPAPKIGCMNKDPNDPLQALPESSPIKQQLLPPPAQAVHLKIITLNIRGLGTGTADNVEMIHQHKPDILIVTELKATRNSKKSLSKQLGGNGYYQYYSNRESKDDEPQAGVLIMVQKKFPNLGAIVPLATPEPLQGYIQALQISLPSSTPLDVVGVYMPTGQSQTKQLREQIYDALAALKAQADSDEDTHHLVIGGDFNATLCDTDRRSNRCVHTDRQHRHKVKEIKLHPMDPPNTAQPRNYTWRQGAGEDLASRIDDFYTNEAELAKVATCTVLDMGGSTTDHDALLQVDIPYRALNMIPPPDRPPTIPDTKKLKLPLTQDETTTLRDIIELNHGECFQRLSNRLEQILQQDVYPHWAAIADRAPRMPAAIPSIAGFQSREDIQNFVNTLGEQIIDLLTAVRDTVLTEGPTVQSNPSGFHLYPRGVARQRKVIKANVKQVAAAIRHQDDTLISGSALQKKWEALQLEDPARTPEEGLKQLKKDLSKELRTLDQEHSKLCQQEHLKKMQALYDNKQKIGNKMITGQYKGKNNAALQAIQTEGGLVTDPQAIVELIEKYYTNKMISATSNKTGKYMPDEAPRQYPWEQEISLDSFKLETAITTGEAPIRWLHTHIQDAQAFQACLKTLSHGKAPGPDGVTNEMLQLLPVEGQQILHAFIQLMWASSCTPTSWKHSITALLWKEKGTVLELKYYRRIGLEYTVYKLWTRMITWAMADHAERNNILTYTQGGFRNKRTTADQLELMTIILEDAKLTQQDIYLAMIDYTEAFDTIDHDRLLQILYDLGFPTDAIEVVKNLYTGATTAIKTPHGSTAAIPMERGTIQGDSLSPFLFIVYLEPLLRWLRVGVNGYIPGVYKQCTEESRVKQQIPDSTYADDLNLVSHTAPRLQKQLDKVTAYSAWGHLLVNTSKTLLTGARYHTHPKNPYECSSLQRILSTVRVQGQPVTFHDPRKPFRYLGVHFTMHLDWSHQLHLTTKALRSMLKGIKASNAKVYQKMRTIKSCIRSKVRYTFCVAPYTDRDIQDIDSLISRACKCAHGLPTYLAQAFVHEDQEKGGLGCPSMQVEYKEVATQRLIAALNDPGPLGNFSRSRMEQDRHCLDHMTAKLYPTLAK